VASFSVLAQAVEVEVDAKAAMAREALARKSAPEKRGRYRKEFLRKPWLEFQQNSF